MNNQIQDQLSLLLKVAQIAKASTKGPPDPEGSDDDQGLDDYLGQLVDPDDPDPDSNSANAIHDSLIVGLHLAKAKVGILQGNDVKTHQALNKAMAFHTRLHGQVAAAHASELNPMRIRQEQD